MSFTLRNLFSEEDGEPNTEWGGEEAGSGSREGLSASAKKEEPTGQLYQVSELLPFIPPAIAADSGIPMEKEIRIPFSEEGSTDVMLSTVYEHCPELFGAEITPLNDSVITLPAKLGAASPARETKAPSSIFDAPGTPFGAPGFSAPSKEIAAAPATQVIEAPAAKPEDNPFWSPEPSQTAEAKVEKTEKSLEPSAKTEIPAGFSDKLPAEVTQKDEGNAFGEPPSEKAAAPARKADPMAGFGAPTSPPAKNPFGDGPPPVPEAKDSPFAENPFESNEGFATLFSRQAEDDADIPFPGSGGDESTWGAMFDSENEEEEESPSAVAPGLGEMIKQQDASSRKEEEVVAEAPPEPTPVSEMPQFAGFGAPPAKPAPAPETPAAKEPAPAPQPELSPQPAAAPAPAPAAAAVSAFSAPPKASVPEVVPPAEEEEAKPFTSLREPVVAQAAEETSVEVEEFQAESPKAPVTASLPGEVDVSLKDLEFRAIFSSDDSFTLAKVARKVVALEGVNACALATPAKLVQASRNEQSRLGDEAREMVDAIRNLAKLTGLPEARSFTLKTDRGTVSLFLEGDCCVTVNHQSAQFGPGVREKLILIARSIHKLEE